MNISAHQEETVQSPGYQTRMNICSLSRDSVNVSTLVALQFAGELTACMHAGCPRKPSVEGGVQHLVQVFGGDEVEVGSDVVRKLLQVLLVAFWEDDSLHSGPVGRQDLVLDPAHLRMTEPSGLLTLEPPRGSFLPPSIFICLYFSYNKTYTSVSS